MLRFGIGAFAVSYRLLCVQTAVLGQVKGAIKKIYAELVSITGYASPCKWGIYHININLGQERLYLPKEIHEE